MEKMRMLDGSKPQTGETQEAKTAEQKKFLEKRMGLKISSGGFDDDKPIIKRDFFGREVASKAPSDPAAENNSTTAGKKVLFYKFYEGHTNAVRRPVKVRDL